MRFYVLFLLFSCCTYSQESFRLVGNSFYKDVEIYNFFTQVEKGRFHKLEDRYLVYEKLKFDSLSMFILNNGSLHSDSYIMFQLSSGRRLFIKKYQFDSIYLKISFLNEYNTLLDREKNVLIKSICDVLINRTCNSLIYE